MLPCRVVSGDECRRLTSPLFLRGDPCHRSLPSHGLRGIRSRARAEKPQPDPRTPRWRRAARGGMLGRAPRARSPGAIRGGPHEDHPDRHRRQRARRPGARRRDRHRQADGRDARRCCRCGRRSSPAAAEPARPILEVEERTGAEHISEAAAAHAREAGVDATAAHRPRRCRGLPSPTPPRSFGADMLVVGSRGHGPLSGAVLGSVSHALVRRSPVPVTIVRHAVAHAA